MLSELTGLAAPRFRVPYGVAYTAALFDEALSKSYKTGRQTAKIVDEVAKAGKTNMKRIISALKENSFNARINENTILLRVIK